MAQELNPVTWTYEAVEKTEFIQLVFTADIADGWYLYAQDLPEGGPIPSSFHFETDAELSFPTFAIEQSEFIVQGYDEMFGMELKKFKHQAVFTHQITKETSIKTIKGYLEFMCCDDTQCLAPKLIEFNLNLK